ncbi:MAG: hypothetical protein QM753_02580 [Thermomicrobiales bacterium]
MVLVLIVVLALLAGIGYFFVREAGQENVQEWLTAPRQLKQSVSAFVARPAASTVSGRDPGVMVDPAIARTGGATGRVVPGPAQDAALPYGFDGSALRDLRDEFRDELRQTASIARDFDARLTRMESALTDVRRMPDDVGRSLREQEDRRQREFDRLQQEIGTMRLTLGRWGERRGEALADVYGNLAKVEVALAAVVNPMLLPGETLVLPTEFTPEALQWNAWGEVGERAFAFGNAFNQNRYVLDESLAVQVETFIMTLRQGLTRDVFPAVRDGNPTDAQIVQMRSGLSAIIEELPSVRRTIEVSYRETGVPSGGSGAVTASAPREDVIGRSVPVDGDAAPEAVVSDPDPDATVPLTPEA